MFPKKQNCSACHQILLGSRRKPQFPRFWRWNSMVTIPRINWIYCILCSTHMHLLVGKKIALYFLPPGEKCNNGILIKNMEKQINLLCKIWKTNSRGRDRHFLFTTRFFLICSNLYQFIILICLLTSHYRTVLPRTTVYIKGLLNIHCSHESKQ